MVSIVSLVAAAIAVGVSLALALYDPVLPRDVPRLEPRPDQTQAQQSPGQQAQDILDRCVNGRLAFRPPSPLKQGQTVEFIVRAAPSTSRLNGAAARLAGVEGMPLRALSVMPGYGGARECC